MDRFKLVPSACGTSAPAGVVYRRDSVHRPVRGAPRHVADVIGPLERGVTGLDVVLLTDSDDSGVGGNTPDGHNQLLLAGW